MPCDVLYLHGYGVTRPDEVPHVIELRQAGFNCYAPAMNLDSIEAAVNQVCTLDFNPAIVVAFSRGAAVAVALNYVVPLVLIAPVLESWDRCRTISTDFSDVRILHSSDDQVVDITESVELLARSGRSLNHLYRIGSSHRLDDRTSLKHLSMTVCEMLGIGS